MEYLKITDLAKKWGLSERGVQALCSQGKIEGATRFGRSWMIPRNAKKPIDGRTKAGKSYENKNMPLPRKTPFLYMSDLYHTPGTADNVGESLAYNHEAQVLFEAEVAYSRGDIDKVYESANYLLGRHSGFYAVLSAGMLLAQCAVWKGDINMWRRAKVHIAEASAKNDYDRDAMQLALSAVDIMPRNTKAVYDVVTTYGMHREMIFTLSEGAGRNYIEAVNTRTGEYHQIPYNKDFSGNFIYVCERFIEEHFGIHLTYFTQKSYQKGE